MPLSERGSLSTAPLQQKVAHGAVVKILPMKILLVVRGGSSFFGPIDDRGITASAPSSLFTYQETEDLRPLFISGNAEEEVLYAACVLPASLFLETKPFSMPVPAIVYGGSDMAWPCFEAGAFDFMLEGWTLLELEARLYRLFSPAVYCQDGILALRGRTLAWWNSGHGDSPKTVMLTHGEAELLRCLLARRGRVAVAGSLPGSPQGSHVSSGSPAGTRALSMRVSRLKAKLSGLREGLGTNIEAVRGVGYLWIHR